MLNPVFWPGTALLVLCSVVLAWVPDLGADAAFITHLALDRQGLIQAELPQIWRLWTGHLVHFSMPHLCLNLLVVAITGSVVERYMGRLNFAIALVCSVALISAGLLLWQKTLLEYRGLSAIATMLTVIALFVAAKQHRAATIYVALLGICLGGKLLSEGLGISLGTASLPAGVVVEWRAHVLGAAAGLMLIGWLTLVKSIGRRKPQYGRLQPI